MLLLTGHFGGWEIGSFFHSLQGHPMQIVVRHLDNPYVDALVTRYRGLHDNTMIGKDGFARGLITAMRKNKTVGILMDTNMTPPQGVFVDFFGMPACNASGVARVACIPEPPGSGFHHLGFGAANIASSSIVR